MTRILAISPHLDDAVLSAGGSLFDLQSRGHDVTVVTMFAGLGLPPYSKAARFLHRVWKLPDDPVSIRRAEDGKALEILGVQQVHADFLDAIYRRNADDSWLLGDEFQPADHPQDDEPDLAKGLEQSVADYVEQVRPNLMLTCAAIGNHIDHRRTRNAVLAVAIRTGIDVELWEDMPYGALTQNQPDLPAEVSQGVPVPRLPSIAAWEAKYRAISCYESQLTMLGAGDKDLRPTFETHAFTRGTEYGCVGRAELFWNVAVKHAVHGNEDRSRSYVSKGITQ